MTSAFIVTVFVVTVTVVFECFICVIISDFNFVFQLGVVLLEQGKASQALAYLDKALEIDPEHGQALLNSAILLQEFGRPELRSIARERLLKLLVMDGKCKEIQLIAHSNCVNECGKSFKSYLKIKIHICCTVQIKIKQKKQTAPTLVNRKC